ncbi:hypothetical protein J6590_008005 [Homalodisca vitripennis]|nr:hypothetical protein J6590_008005 [Homalodisca vitripennis]
MSDDGKPERRRKGEGSWQTARKKMRTARKAYTTKQNKLVEAKQPPPVNVVCKCKFDCKKLDHEHKLKLFTDFYKISDCETQNTYLMGLINLCPINRRHKGVVAELSRKQTSISFSVSDGLLHQNKKCTERSNKFTFTNMTHFQHKTQIKTMKKKAAQQFSHCYGFMEPALSDQIGVSSHTFFDQYLTLTS